MMKVVRIICIWMYCICCLCGHTQLPTVSAIPYEYFDEHEQLSYDLETEQSKAKYDSHLLAQQLKKDSNYDNESLNNLNKNIFQHNNDLSVNEQDSSLDDTDFEPHARAASCYTNGHKYTHGQKVPRIDKCEVCLCMDGEIFCWWEKCDDKKRVVETKELPKITRSYNKSWQTIETSTQTTKRNKQRQHQQLYNELKRKPETGEQVSSEQESWQKLQSKGENKTNKKQTSYEKTYRKPTKATETETNIDYDVEQQQQQPQQKHLILEHKSISQSNKIFNFPENLPSVLYYDYRTEEHQHHQHQHHQQHLKHQHELEDNANNYKKNNNDSIMTYKQHQSTTSAHLFGNTLAENELNTDSDILPEPPTKKPQMTTVTLKESSMSPILNAITTTTTSTTTTTTTTKHGKGTVNQDNSTFSTQNDSTPAAVKQTYTKGKLVIGTQAVQEQKQQQQFTSSYDFDNSDEAFHRWLTSNIMNQSNNDTYDNINTTTATTVTTIRPALEVWPNINIHKTYLHNDTRQNISNGSSSKKDSGTGIVDIDILLIASADKQLKAPKQEILEQWQKAQEPQPQQQHKHSESITLEADHILAATNDLSTVTTEPETERHCNVMGTLYKIGAVLPQDAGNCLQCACIEDASADHTPRVTCSPHNCPPLVLPDFLDATGY